MNRIKKYQKIIKEVLQERMAFPTRDFPNLQHILIIDHPQQHFLLFTIGWDRGKYHHSTIFHLEIKNNAKIWVHEVNSSFEIDKALIEKGVAEKDIIGGMIEPYTLAEMEGEVAAV